MGGGLLIVILVAALAALAVVARGVWLTTRRDRRDLEEYRRLLRLQGFSDDHIERRVKFVRRLPASRRSRWLYRAYWRKR